MSTAHPRLSPAERDRQRLEESRGFLLHAMENPEAYLMPQAWDEYEIGMVTQALNRIRQGACVLYHFCTKQPDEFLQMFGQPPARDEYHLENFIDRNPRLAGKPVDPRRERQPETAVPDETGKRLMPLLHNATLFIHRHLAAKKQDRAGFFSRPALFDDGWSL